MKFGLAAGSKQMQFSILAVDSRQQVVALNLEAASEARAADQVRAAV